MSTALPKTAHTDPARAESSGDAPPEAGSWVVAVRALCDFTARQGDLDLRFTPSPTAQEGMAGHALVAARRGPGYQPELSLSGCHGLLRVRGRADGFDAARGRLEEIKTHKGPLEAMPANHRHLHWAQLKVYGALLCEALSLPEVELALVYVDVGTQRETVLVERHTAAALRAGFEALCERFLAWARQEQAHRRDRDAALRALAFPHAAFRAGQRELAEAVYRAAVSGRCLLAQAPTGIGKTVGTVFPLLKACPGQGLDKLFFLSAKTSGRALALRALETLQPAGPLRTLELVARHTACEHPDRACHGESCPLARGFYDKLPAARAAALAQSPVVLDRGRVRAVALAHGVCPYYLGQELARWCDVVVGDYNHYFDLHAMLHALAQMNQWRVGVLVDEAHNLVERGRRMYSAELHQARLDEVRDHAVAALKKPLDRLRRAWQALNKAPAGGEGQEGDPDEAAAPVDGPADGYTVHDTLPSRWLGALQQVASAIGDHFSEHPTEVDGELQAFYLEALHFLRLAELFDTHTLCDVTRHPPGRGRRGITSTVCLRNVFPAPFLGPRFAAARTVTLFSATLQPEGHCREMLGLPPDTPWVDVDSPFQAAQLTVRVARHISTRYRDRAASLPLLVAVMARQWEAAPGNYLAFFSSHDYLAQVAERFQALHPQVPVWLQARGMGEDAQREFLARFTADGQGIGFAVLGGSFAEGIDLPGRRLIGAFIATLGMPQVNPVNEHIRQRLDGLLGDGHACTYLYPGLHKVVQAAGRVIRTDTDQGVLHLLDDRFQRRDVRRLLPRWWKVG